MQRISGRTATMEDLTTIVHNLGDDLLSDLIRASAGDKVDKPSRACLELHIPVSQDINDLTPLVTES